MVSGSFKLSFHVSKTFYGRLIGPKGSTKRRIEEETQSKIYFPRQHEESSNVTIKAKERNQVCAALRQIRSLVGAIRRKIPIHLLVVPLNFDEVQNRVLHWVPMCCCESCRSILADLTTPFEIKVKGLDISDNDPSSARVGYGCIEAPELQRFANRCLSHFQATGLSASAKKLHMVVLKNHYRMTAMNCPFDAREILKRFGDFDFGAVQCSTVHLVTVGLTLSTRSAEVWNSPFPL
ncbi:uncharacterized protein LOC108160420 isoform X1 [Drosophila miranda]|uniref:uncharacterized protein LOC108160420 isoform X1 n=1 Tax=Drosophila miranda TaxID=7229 RepID=UPI0007E79AB8|nr:uncharacterized protein LOC108160420 isoform X1 [Drosophila miranda]